jgi:hypothetical protein
VVAVAVGILAMEEPVLLHLPLAAIRVPEPLVRVMEPMEVARAIVVSAQLALTMEVPFPLIPAVT